MEPFNNFCTSVTGLINYVDFYLYIYQKKQQRQTSIFIRLWELFLNCLYVYPSDSAKRLLFDVKRSVEIGAAVLHNVGANIQAKQMSHFPAAPSPQRSVACMCGTNAVHSAPLHTDDFTRLLVCVCLRSHFPACVSFPRASQCFPALGPCL